MENEFFLGLRPFEAADCGFLPSREDETKRLSFLLDNESVTVLCGESKSGKTSLINAGLFNSEKLRLKKVRALKFDVPPFNFGDKVLEKQLVDFFNSYSEKPSYIDAAFENDGSLWYASKKLQAANPECKRFWLVFDSFENFFTYTEASRKEFAKALAGLLYGDVPEKFASQIQDIMLGKSDTVISKDYLSMLYDSLKISVLFSVSKSSYSLMSELNDSIRGILQNTVYLAPFDFSAAENAVSMLSKQPFEGLPETVFEDGAASKLVSKLSFNSLVSPAVLRSAVFYFRKNYPVVNEEVIENSVFFKLSRFEKFLNTVDNADEKQKFLQFLGNECVIAGESQPLPAFWSKAEKKYGLDKKILDSAVEHCVLKRLTGEGGRISYLPFDAEIFRSLPSLQHSETPQHIEIQRNSFIKPPEKKAKAFWRQPVALACMAVAAVSVAFVFLAFSLKGDAERSANIAKSNMLTAFAFQKLETDPTFSLRLSQKAVALDTSNVQAYSALLNSFYNTDIFYNISGEIRESVVKAEISHGGKYVLTFVKNDGLEKYSARDRKSTRLNSSHGY